MFKTTEFVSGVQVYFLYSVVDISGSLLNPATTCWNIQIIFGQRKPFMSKFNFVKSWSPYVNKLVKKKKVEEANDIWQKLRLKLFTFTITLKLIRQKIDKLLLVAGNTQLLCLAYKRTVKCLVQKSPDFIGN